MKTLKLIIGLLIVCGIVFSIIGVANLVCAYFGQTIETDNLSNVVFIIMGIFLNLFAVVLWKYRHKI